MADVSVEWVERPALVLQPADIAAADMSDEDVTALIRCAQEVLEVSLSRLIGARVLKVTYGQWTGSVVLPHDPTAILSVTAAGTATEAYFTDGRILTVEGGGPVSVTYACGWSGATVPDGVKAALKVIVTDLIQNPEVLSGKDMYSNAEVESHAALYRLMR